MTDQTYRGWVLDNPLRRLLAPPRARVDQLDPRPGERVVDLGAGVGYYADTILGRLGPTGHLILVDIDASNLQRYLRHHGPDPRLETIVSSAAHVPTIAGGSVDRVLLADVLCDVADKQGLLDEAWRMLRPGGVALCSFHASPAVDASHPLWVTPAVWESVRASHDWLVRSEGGHPRHPWHLLEKR